MIFRTSQHLISVTSVGPQKPAVPSACCSDQGFQQQAGVPTSDITAEDKPIYVDRLQTPGSHEDGDLCSWDPTSNLMAGEWGGGGGS